MDLTGQLLIAMPEMADDRFARSVVLVVSHGEDGAMGLVLNQPVASPGFTEVLDELGIEVNGEAAITLPRVLRGGPVEQGRGFVLHSLDHSGPGTLRVGDDVGMSTTLDILRKVASPEPPRRSALYLGYAGWGGGQLEQEIASNGWLTVEDAQDLVLKTPPDRIYQAALSRLGVDEALLSGAAGHA